MTDSTRNCFMHVNSSYYYLPICSRFCKGDVLKAYVLLLADFQKNSTHTNHCIIKMLHRISIDLGYMGMVFQASLFRVFQKILLSPLAKAARYKVMIECMLDTQIVKRA